MIRYITSSLYIVVLIVILTTFVGCVWTPEVTYEVKYIDKPYEVKVPIKCIVPDANCSFDRHTYTEVISSMLECIIDMKRNQEICK